MSNADIDRARRHMTGMDAWHVAIRDDLLVPRCLVCLASLPENRVRPEYAITLRIAHFPLVHGYECLSCGMGDPPTGGDE